MTSRRGFLLGLTTALAAPAVVRAESLMKLWVPPAPELVPFVEPAEYMVELFDAFRLAKLEVLRDWQAQKVLLFSARTFA